MKIFYVYILKCSDDSFYTGLTSNLEQRITRHQSGYLPTCYTFKRRPVELMFYLEFQKFDDAMLFEKKIKGWSRKKKLALIAERWEDLPLLSRNYTQFGRPDDSSTSLRQAVMVSLPNQG